MLSGSVDVTLLNVPVGHPSLQPPVCPPPSVLCPVRPSVPLPTHPSIHPTALHSFTQPSRPPPCPRTLPSSLCSIRPLSSVGASVHPLVPLWPPPDPTHAFPGVPGTQGCSQLEQPPAPIPRELLVTLQGTATGTARPCRAAAPGRRGGSLVCHRGLTPRHPSSQPPTRSPTSCTHMCQAAPAGSTCLCHTCAHMAGHTWAAPCYLRPPATSPLPWGDWTAGPYSVGVSEPPCWVGGPGGRGAGRCAVSAPSPAGRLPDSSTPTGSRRLCRGQAGPERCRSKKGLEKRNQVRPAPPASPWQAAAAPSRKQREDPAPVTSPPVRTARASAWRLRARSRNRPGPAAPATERLPPQGPAEPEDGEGALWGAPIMGLGSRRHPGSLGDVTNGNRGFGSHNACASSG